MDTPPIPTDLSADDAILLEKIYNEESINQRLDDLNVEVERSWKIIWNYWKGNQSSDFETATGIQSDIKNLSLTKEGRLRLTARFNSISKKVLPSFASMAVQLWPLAAIALVKGVLIPVLSKRAKKAYRTHKINRLRTQKFERQDLESE